MTDVDPAWPCLKPSCRSDANCNGAATCGWVGPDDWQPIPDGPPDEQPFADLDDPEPPDDEVEPEPWDPQPIRADEVPDDIPVPIIRTAEEIARSREVYARARRVHVAPAPVDRLYVRLGPEFDPRGRHVGCDGEPGATRRQAAHCGADPGTPCHTPRGRFVPGFVHPTRLAAEMRLYGIDSTTVTV